MARSGPANTPRRRRRVRPGAELEPDAEEGFSLAKLVRLEATAMPPNLGATVLNARRWRGTPIRSYRYARIALIPPGESPLRVSLARARGALLPVNTVGGPCHAFGISMDHCNHGSCGN